MNLLSRSCSVHFQANRVLEYSHVCNGVNCRIVKSGAIHFVRHEHNAQFGVFIGNLRTNVCRISHFINGSKTQLGNRRGGVIDVGAFITLKSARNSRRSVPYAAHLARNRPDTVFLWYFVILEKSLQRPCVRSKFKTEVPTGLKN